MCSAFFSLAKNQVLGGVGSGELEDASTYAFASCQ